MRVLLALFAPAALWAQSGETLPGTARWDFPSDIVAEQWAELRSYYESRWAKPGAPFDLAANRAAIRELTGAVDEFRKPEPRITAVGEESGIRASLAEWPVLRIGTIGPTAGFSGALVRMYGVLLEPTGGGRSPATVFLPDADESAADAAGLGRAVGSGAALALARSGRVVFVPFLTRRRAFSQVWLEDREWLMRLGYQTGRHIVGAEASLAIAAADWLRSLASVNGRIAVAGIGQGAMTAAIASAVDGRFERTFTSGYPQAAPEWEQPPDRLLWKLRSLVDPAGLARAAGAEPIPALPSARWSLRIDPEEIARIENQRFRQWEALYRNLALESWRKRDAGPKPDYSSPAAYSRSMASKLEAYRDLVGRFPEPQGPLDARSVKVYDEPGFTGYRLRVRTYDNVHAYGILCVPKGMKPAERRPVVFISHGLAGRPEDSIGLDPKARPEYSQFGLRLLERGYIVMAVMIATQDNVERQKLIRRAHPVGLTPAGMDVRKFDRLIDYLETLPFVDKSRIAFYGLSYGGYTALWTGPGVPRFQAVICSGHFNEWTAKTVDLTMGTAYPHYANVADQYNFGMLNRFDHSDLAALIAPRAFLIEMGDADGVIVEPRAIADREIDQALEPWRFLGIPRSGRVARFDGPHRIDGAEAYPFLDEHLNWTPRR